MLRLVALVTVALGSSLVVMPGASPPATGASRPATGPSLQRALLDDPRELLDQYCVSCHNQDIVASTPVSGESLQRTQLRELGLTLDTEDVANVAANPEAWEKVVRKLNRIAGSRGC